MTYFQSRPAAGRHFLHVPGPSNIPDRVLRAIDYPAMDHRSADFGLLGRQVLEALRPVFGTTQPVIVYPSSGTGAWEASLVNTLSPGDTVLMCRTGWFATLWQEMARKLGLEPRIIETDWRRGADVAAIGAALANDRAQRIKAVCVVHNETSTGSASDIAAVRRAIDDAGHPALLMVDAISSVGSMEYRHDDWGVDVTICGSQKGMMMPPGLGFNAVSRKALEAARTAPAAAQLLGLAADAGDERDRLLSVHAGDQPALRAERGDAHVAGRGAGERLRPARPTRRSDAPRHARLGLGEPVP